MTRRPYMLAAHVYVCIVDDQAVLLDIDQDAYFGMDADQTRALATLVEYWPPVDTRVSTDRHGARALAEALRQRGLLAESDEELPTWAASSVLPVRASLRTWDSMTWRGIRVCHVVSFVRCVVLVAALMRFRSLRYLTSRASRRNAAFRNADASEEEIRRAKELLSAFYHLRAFAYAKRGKCLFDSAVLLEFLASHAVHARWVIGVQTRPFIAHSWLQLGHYVLNGTPEGVRDFVPIFVA